MPSASVKKNHTDLVGLVGFHDRGFIVAKPAEPHAHWLQERVTSLPKRVAGNSTNMTDGLRKGLEILEKTPKNRYRRIWLLTDGKNNREQDKLMSMVAQAGLLHVNINTIGFGNPGSKWLWKLSPICCITSRSVFPDTDFRGRPMTREKYI
jgi:Mg-chelatase subunit ChlD